MDSTRLARLKSQAWDLFKDTDEARSALVRIMGAVSSMTLRVTDRRYKRNTVEVIVDPLDMTLHIDLLDERGHHKDCTELEKLQILQHYQNTVLIELIKRHLRSEYRVWIGRHTGTLGVYIRELDDIVMRKVEEYAYHRMLTAVFPTAHLNQHFIDVWEALFVDLQSAERRAKMCGVWREHDLRTLGGAVLDLKESGHTEEQIVGFVRQILNPA